MRFKELSWAEIKNIKNTIKTDYRDLDELIAMIYLLSDSDCRDIVIDRLNELSDSENVQSVMGLIHDHMAESIQRRLLRKILTNKQSISIIERLYKRRTGVINEDIVNLWSGLSIVIGHAEPPDKNSFHEYIEKSMNFIVEYFESIKVKSKNVVKFNQARAIVAENIRGMFRVSHEAPDYTDFSLLKAASTRTIKPITLIHFYILSLAFAIKGSRIFCIEDTPCLRLNNGYFYISNFPDHLFSDEAARALLAKHGIDTAILYEDNSEADFVRSLLLRFYRNGIIKKSMYKVINSALKHYNELLMHHGVNSIHSIE